MTCSPARLAANRANAQKSTGPRSPEGKESSRTNALRHGLTGSGVALPPEQQAVLDAHVRAWSAPYPHTGPEDEYLLRQLALCCVRIDAAPALLEQLTGANRLRDLAHWDDDRELAALDLLAELPSDPARISRRLRRSSHGCRLLASRWTVLLHGLDRDRCSWTDDDIQVALDLLGLPPSIRQLDRTAAWLTASVARAREADPAARDALRERLQDEIAALEARAASLEESIESPQREGLEDHPGFDFSPEAERIRRHEAAAWRLFWRLIRELDRRQSTRTPVRPTTPPPTSRSAEPLPGPLPKSSLASLLRSSSAPLSSILPPGPRSIPSPANRTQAAPSAIARPPGPKPSERR